MMRESASLARQARNGFLKAIALTAAASSYAQTVTTYSEQNKLIRAPQAVTRLGDDLFGDKVNLYTGSLDFSQTDVSLPGNSLLPVSVGRRMVAGREATPGTHFGGWDLEIPHLHGIFSSAKGWTNPNGSTARCSNFGVPPTISTPASGASWLGTEYWHGSFLYIPGQGDQELLPRVGSNTSAPTGNAAYTYPLVTRNNWQIRCLATLNAANGGQGEGFVAVSPDGTQYQFDWLVSRALYSIQKSTLMSVASVSSIPDLDPSAEDAGTSPQRPETPELPRAEVWILPTVITDRFGNKVTYTYDTTNKWQLKSIVGDDASGSARTLTLTYVNPGSTASTSVQSVSDGTRTWKYAYNGSGLTARLKTVTLPDNSAWQLDSIAPLAVDLVYQGDGNCDDPGIFYETVVTGSMTHPSGASGTFTLTPTRHGRAGVQNVCKFDSMAQTYTATYARLFDSYALTSKQLSGPGLETLTWTTDYPDAQSSWAPCNACVADKTVRVTNPAGDTTQHTFGTLYRETEGQLQKVEVVSRSGDVLRSTTTRYRAAVAPFGVSLQARGDGYLAAQVMEVDQRITSQQGETFKWEANAFDAYAHPTEVTRSSSLGYSRTENTTYDNNLSKWVIGQVGKVTSAGKTMTANTYDATTATLSSVSSFGSVQRSMTYYADGTLKTLADGAQQTTTFSNYKRGIAQNIAYADGKSESAAVNNLGHITSLTNEAETTTTFGYDTMGRLTSITYPAADTVAWTGTTISFMRSTSSQNGLPAGHWQQLVSTGNGHAKTYFDALWRPVFVERWDSADSANTFRITRQGYDFASRTTFESYPKRSYAALGDGMSTAYDSLGRVTGTTSDSELGSLHTSFSYDAGFQATKTDARGNRTTNGYQAFDVPDESALVRLSLPENVDIAIARDTFGKATAIVRSGAGSSVTRRYVYDSNERLCKTIEPEAASTVQAYDAANNVQWRVTGAALSSASACDTEAASAMTGSRNTFGYDKRNRLTTSVFGDNSPSITRTYTADGLPSTIASNGTTWTYTYNKRRLLESESLAYGAKVYNIERGYDANGSASRLIYPVNSLTIDYAPNALGEPSRIGSYATNLTYHPNGAVASFTYGNGIVRNLTQNTRGLPLAATDGAILRDTYTYDKNGNVSGITDEAGASTSRTMQYDGLDRLTSVTAPSLWGTTTYGYDAQDNLTSAAMSAGANARNTLLAINTGTNRLDSVSGGPAKFNFGYGYDARGNVTTRGAQTYTFDLANRMTSAKKLATYQYDGLGRRVSIVGTDGQNRLQVYSQAGQLLYSTVGLLSATKYVYLHNHVIAEVK